MKFVADLGKGILGTADSPELWSDIVGRYPDEMLTDPDAKFLNLACGHLTEACLLVKRMMALGVSVQEANSKIYVLDKYSTFTNAAKMQGYQNVIQADFTEWETDMKFDGILTNPPYQDQGGHNTLYPKFYNKAVSLLKEDGIIAMICPPAILPGIWGLKNVDSIKMTDPIEIVYVDVSNDVKEYFPGVGSDFCWFMSKNAPSNNDSVEVKVDGGVITASGPTFPRNVTDVSTAQSILNKAFKFNADPYKISSSDYGKQAKTSNRGKHEAVESISQDGTVHTRKITWHGDHRHLGSPKVIMSMYGKSAVIDYSHNLVSACSGGGEKGHNIMTVLTENDSEAESLVSILDSRLQVFYNVITNGQKSPYTNFLKHFVGVDLDKVYTNEELEKSLGLTKKEQKFLNEFQS